MSFSKTSLAPVNSVENFFPNSSKNTHIISTVLDIENNIMLPSLFYETNMILRGFNLKYV